VGDDDVNSFSTTLRRWLLSGNEVPVIIEEQAFEQLKEQLGRVVFLRIDDISMLVDGHPNVSIVSLESLFSD
jgi:hypothetical protein